jgi:hypothetical protein
MCRRARADRAWASPRVSIPAGVCGLTGRNDTVVDQIVAWDDSLLRRDLGLSPEVLQDGVRRASLELFDLL